MATEIAKYSFDNVKVMWTKLQEDRPEAPYQGEGTHIRRRRRQGADHRSGEACQPLRRHFGQARSRPDPVA